MLSIDIKQSEGLAEKRYKELSKNEMELEHFCNDVLYLFGFPTRIQKSPVPVLSFVTDQTSIKKLSSQFQFASYFSYDSTTKSYSTLKRTLIRILQTDTNKSKFLLLSTGIHVVGIFYQNDRCYFYDSNYPFKRLSFDFDTKDPTIAIGKISDMLGELISENQNFGRAGALGIDVLSNEELIELKEKRETLFHEIDPGKNTINFGEYTPLFIAAQYGYLDVVKYLVENGTGINKATDDGKTPLYIAAQNGFLDVVKCLVGHKADVNKAGDYGITPLYIAAEKGHLDVVKYLIAHEADVNKARDDGITPLGVSAFNGRLEVVEELIKHHANINVLYKNGQTPLHFAVINGHEKVVVALINNGAVDNRLEVMLKVVELLQEKTVI